MSSKKQVLVSDNKIKSITKKDDDKILNERKAYWRAFCDGDYRLAARILYRNDHNFINYRMYDEAFDNLKPTYRYR